MDDRCFDGVDDVSEIVLSGLSDLRISSAIQGLGCVRPRPRVSR